MLDLRFRVCSLGIGVSGLGIRVSQTFSAELC